jgi:uncharacterized membrane protein
MRKSYILIFIIILLLFGIGIYAYPSLPDQLVSHWGANGEPNGYMGKFWGVFLTPVISLVMLLFFIILPKIDPLKANYAKFQKYFDGFISALILFLFYIYLLTLAWNLGYRYDMMRWLTPAISALIYSTGVLISKTERNWFIGIRTPWTISSDRVWADTHRLGGILFKAAGAISLSGIIWPDYFIWLFFAPLVLISVFLLLYSYWDYRKIEKK